LVVTLFEKRANCSYRRLPQSPNGDSSLPEGALRNVSRSYNVRDIPLILNYLSQLFKRGLTLAVSFVVKFGKGGNINT